MTAAYLGDRPWVATGGSRQWLTAPALAVEDLVAGYGGVIALDRVRISAGTAAITAVLGANGAGKTTLLRAISGLVRPAARADPAGRRPT